MVVEFQDLDPGKQLDTSILKMKIKGALTIEDYEIIVPMIEQIVEQNGKVRMLVELYDFQGWNFEPDSTGPRFRKKEFKDLEKIALVTDYRWRGEVVIFSEIFSNAEVKLFDPDGSVSAVKWILT